MYRRYLIFVLSSFVMLSTMLQAETEAVKQENIKVLIERVKTVPPSQRRLLMNELKLKLRSMHQETRKQVMLELRSSFNKHQTGYHKTGIKSNMHHQHTMSMSEAKNMQEHMNKERMQMKKPPGDRPPGLHTPMRGN